MFICSGFLLKCPWRFFPGTRHPQVLLGNIILICTWLYCTIKYMKFPFVLFYMYFIRAYIVGTSNECYGVSNRVGNIYKPPKDNNNSVNVKGFVSQLEPISSYLSNTNSEVLICGDYNINLLKVNFEPHFNYFFDTMLTHSFFPKITFPTRVNNSRGATLINNVLCKQSPISKLRPEYC